MHPSLDEQTPLMKQYWELKAQAPDALLFFRMGDFYELFGPDAVEASRLLEITLTSRDRNKPNPMPMAGVPHHSVQNYIQKLLKAGKKIAIGEQMEDPEQVKGTKIVRREIIRILTPGIHFDAEGFEVHYLAVLLKTPRGAGAKSTSSLPWILACLDASTGETLVSQPGTLEDLLAEASHLSIKHLLKLDDTPVPIDTNSKILVETLPKNYITAEKAKEVLKRHYDVGDLNAFLPSESACLALGLLVAYVLRTQLQEKLAHLRLPEPLQKPASLILGPNTAQNLDLPELFHLINKTRSTLGARTLKRWLYAPLSNVQTISSRQKAAQELSQLGSVSETLGSELAKVYDLERIMGRVNTRLANPRDTLALGISLGSLKKLSSVLGSSLAKLENFEHRKNKEEPLLSQIQNRLAALSETLSPISTRLLDFQNEDAPLTSKDGGIFKMGLNPDLDRLISLTKNGQAWLAELETREREKTGIASLKVRYNRVFGYYLEVTQAHLKNVPSHYQRKQTMVGAERFFTEELKRFEEEILTAGAKQKSLEQELFQQFLDEIQKLTSSIMEAAETLGKLDSLLSLSHGMKQPGWCLPEIDDTLDLEIETGRHPMVDQSSRGQFVPNHMSLSSNTRLTLMITGPNMGGKSTVMRQTALILILGQMGSSVPAHKARWGVVSSIYTRIGAQDAISRGQSTFMVEMSELAHILHHANERSFLILDEIGRGTSTYDGMSVAWATIEWIVTRLGCRTLFATHYHEITELASTLPRVANAHMAVEGAKNSQASQLRFLYELREGPTADSFGIHVAQLAGIPKPVVQRAWKILHELETGALLSHSQGNTHQLSLFQSTRVSSETSHFEEFEDLEDEGQLPGLKTQTPEPHPVLVELSKVDLEQLTPLQALNLVAKLKDLHPSSSPDVLAESGAESAEGF